MPPFFIDTYDGATVTRDERGTTFEGVSDAQKAAVASLPALVDAGVPDGEDRVFRAVLRDGSGVAIYEASLTFHGEWVAKRE